MTPRQNMPEMTPGDILDTIALLRAYLADDLVAQAVICENGNHSAMLSASISLTVGMLTRTVEEQQVMNDYLDGLAQRVLGMVTP